MKPLKLHIVSLLLLASTLAYGKYGNEWIEYNLTYYKFNIMQVNPGLCRISYATLSSLPDTTFRGTQISKINLFSKGEAVPLYIHDANGNGYFNANDFIEFYGERNDGSLDSNLYANPLTDQPNPYVSLFNDTAVYFLVANSQLPVKRISNSQNNLVNPPAKEAYFMHTERYSQTAHFLPGREHNIGGKPVHESVFAEGEGFGEYTNIPQVGMEPGQIYRNAPVNAHINANIIIPDQDGMHTISMETELYQFPSDTFYNSCLRKYSLELPLSKLLNFEFFTVFSNGRKSIALVELTYPHEFSLPQETRFYFALNAGSNAARYLEISSFEDRGTSPILYDLTNNLRITGSTASIGVPHKFVLPPQSGTARRELFLTSQNPADIVEITQFDRVSFMNYINPDFQGDYIILTHPKLRTGTIDYVNEYAKYRQSIDGGMHTVEIVSISQLYDQFAYGIRKHPLAIRNFIDFALDKWSIKPEHLFIIGKGREYVYSSGDPPSTYDKLKYNSQMYAQCLVPTFGHPGSDALLTATRTSITPRVAVGRLSVEAPADINVYLQKVKGYERVQRDAGGQYQTIDNKLWMKRVLHMGGGEGAQQQGQFKTWLLNYEDVIEDTLFGGVVYPFYKTSTAPIQEVQPDYLRELINTGVSLITFFGHSSAEAFDIAIDPPNTFTNLDKYHLLLSNGCFAGYLFNPQRGISEDFVLADGKAAIGFISTATFSSDYGLNVFTENFYKNLGQKNYGNSIGTIMRGTIQDVETCCPIVFNKIIAEEMTLHADPGIKINPHAQPDYALEPQMVSFLPATVNIEDESFELKVIVTNLGKAVDDSVNLVVTRYFPNANDGSISFVKRIRGTYFSDTVSFTIPTGTSESFGLNTFHIKVDQNEEVAELSESNNELGALTLNITSEDVFPIHPYEFAIVPQQPIALKASTANVFAPVNTYRMEIDTTELFNSPLRDSAIITQTGGVLTWTPSITYMDSVVYYWRVGIEGKDNFHNSSFIFIANEYPGWNQSHYYQYKKDNYNNTSIDDDRQFKFISDVRTVQVTTGTSADYGMGGSVPWSQLAHYVNGGLKHRWVCGGEGFPGGLVLAVFDSATGSNWISKSADRVLDPVDGYYYNRVHKNRHCKDRDFEGFDFPTIGSNTFAFQQRIINFVNSVPNGNYILAYSVNSAYYNSWGQDLRNVFSDLGSQLVNDPSITCCSNIPWAFFAQKGHPGTALEAKGAGLTSVLNFQATFTAQWYQGTVTTPLIGPAGEWGSMHWKYHPSETLSGDQQSIDIIGVTHSGSETALDSNITSLDYSIQQINASQYPYIRLRLDTRDDAARTPTQLDYWRVLYKKVPEAALCPNINFSFSDSITLGENLSLSVACENVTEVDMTPLLVKYTLQSSGYAPVNKFVRYDSLFANQTMNLEWMFNSECNCLGDLNTLVIEVNPVPENSTGSIFDQPEQFHFNNFGALTFKMDRDRVNPLLDVTFDGVHIMDGDIVSAYPEILITLKDENKFLLLNDTSLVNVYLVNPSQERVKMRYDDITMRFIEASSGSNNKAQVWLKKEFEENGIYTLQVQARDRSRNISGTYGLADGIDYRISFEVIREAMITNVLNYPNPFTSSTRFVFTLTGIQPPDYFKIQIMTVSGKVVRELTQFDMGPLHVGRNITEYAWDGTDEYGDPLGNGVYLYRVVASIGGEAIEKWKEGPDRNTDKYFKSGFGKMYLAR